MLFSRASMAILRDDFEWAARLFAPALVREKPIAPRSIRVLDLSVVDSSPASADFPGDLAGRVLSERGAIVLTRSVSPV